MAIPLADRHCGLIGRHHNSHQACCTCGSASIVHFVPCSTLKSLYCTASGLADSDMMFGLHLGRKEPRVEERAHFLGRCVLPGPSGALSGEGHSGATDGVGDPSAMASDCIRWCIRPAGTSRFDARPDELARVGCLAVVTYLREALLRSASEPENGDRSCTLTAVRRVCSCDGTSVAVRRSRDNSPTSFAPVGVTQ